MLVMSEVEEARIADLEVSLEALATTLCDAMDQAIVTFVGD